MVAVRETVAGSEFGPEAFLKCPKCHRTNTVSFILHPDGDGWFECDACGSYASAPGLHQSDREWSK